MGLLDTIFVVVLRVTFLGEHPGLGAPESCIWQKFQPLSRSC